MPVRWRCPEVVRPEERPGPDGQMATWTRPLPGGPDGGQTRPTVRARRRRIGCGAAGAHRVIPRRRHGPRSRPGPCSPLGGPRCPNPCAPPEIGLRRAVGPNGRCPARSVGSGRRVCRCRLACGCCPACRCCVAGPRSDQVDAGRRPVGPIRRCRLAVVGLSADPPGELLADPIQCLRPAWVGQPVARICSVAAQNRWLDARIRLKSDRIRRGCCHCSSPTRSKCDSRNGRSMVRRICFSMSFGPILHLIGRYRTAQPHRTANPTGFATPMVGLARPRLLGRHARHSRLGRFHWYPAARHRCLAGRLPGPRSPPPPAWAPVPGSGNRQSHAGAENQTAFEGS